MSLTLDAAIANTIHCIMDCVPLLPLMTRLPCELSSVASSFLSDWEEMIYCGPMVRNAVPTLGTFDLVAPTIRALLDATGSLRTQGVQCIPTVDSILLWTLPLEDRDGFPALAGQQIYGRTCCLLDGGCWCRG